MSPAIEYLMRRWGLEESGAQAAQRFLDAWASGNTRVKVSKDETKSLSKSNAVGDGQQVTPLVLSGEWLQNWRLWQAEGRVADRLLAMASAKAHPMRMQKKLDELFKEKDSAQSKAARLALEKDLVMITGGPGTGKTYTAGRLMALLALEDSHRRFAVAAPTGKAATRLGEALASTMDTLPKSFSNVRPLLKEAAGAAGTLHRLLGWNPSRDNCRFDAEHPLPYDVVMVDEASMLDLSLWDRLLDALDRGTRLIILGDHRQLESVQPGRVLGDLVAAASGKGALAASHVELDRNYRFEAHPGIGRMAEAARNRDSEEMLKALAEKALGEDLVHVPSAEAMDILAKQIHLAQAVLTAKGPEQALEALSQFRILAPMREGRQGIYALNLEVEKLLRAKGHAVGDNTAGRPIIITANDPYSGLYNGDNGVLWADQDEGEEHGEIKAYFQVAGELKKIPVAALPPHETAWALTVHRSQGSEFDTVMVVLPAAPHELIGPELLYTAITRAKSKLVIAADAAALKAACETKVIRESGLAARLKE